MIPTISLTQEEAETAREAALRAAEFMRESAEVHERYCEDELAAEERADEERFEALCERLSALIEGLTSPAPNDSELQSKPSS